MNIDDLDDAIIEDTVHCTVCGYSWVLGGNEDGMILDPPTGMDSSEEYGFGGSQVKLCWNCVSRVVNEWSRWEGEE